MPRSIIIPDDRRLFTASLRRSLMRYLNSCDRHIQRYEVQPADLKTLANPSILNADKTALLILPGINGDTSPYPEYLDKAWREQLGRAVYNGMNVLGLCAGAYYLSHQLIYKKAENLTLMRSNYSALFNGRAQGPLPAFARADHAPDDPYDLSDIATVCIKVLTHSGQTSYPMTACYGNGPAFLHTEDSVCKILARYRDIDGIPPATISITHGGGEVILSGIHTEIGLEDMRAYYAYKGDARTGEDVDRLQESEDMRKHFQARLWQRLCP